MSKAIKKTTIALLSAATCLTALVGVLTNSEIKTNVASAQTVETAGNFETLDGASIRINAGEPSGIRWWVSVTEDFHDYATSLGNVTYYTLVNTSAIKETDHTNDKVVAIPCTATPEFDENGVWKFSAAIVYNQLAEELAGDPYNYNESQIETALETAYDKDLHARAYVEIVGDTTTQIYSEVGDTIRSIRGVATNCLIENTSVTADNKTYFQDLAGVEVDTDNITVETQKTMKLTSMYGEYTMVSNDEGATWTKEFVGEGSATTQTALPAGNYNVYVGGKKVDAITVASETNATAQINGLGTSFYTAGNDYYADFVNMSTGKVYRSPFRYATGVIDEATDMYLLELKDADSTSNGTERTFPNIDGYYIMKNSITEKAVHTMSATYLQSTYLAGGFVGTFEGNGYGWDNAGGRVVFPVIYNGGVIKNFYVKGTGINSFNDKTTVVAGLRGTSTMENVYVEYANSTESNAVCGVVNMVEYTAVLKNCVIVDGKGHGTSYIGMHGLVSFIPLSTYFETTPFRFGGALNNATNVYYISTNYIMSNHSTSGYRFYGANEEALKESEAVSNARVLPGVNRYTTADAYKAATNTLNELPAGFNADLWRIDATNGLVWKA